MALIRFDEFCRKWEIGPYGEEKAKRDTINVDYVKNSEGQEFLSICSQYYSGKIICKNDNNKMNVKIISDDFEFCDEISKRNFDFFDDLGLYICIDICKCKTDCDVIYCEGKIVTSLNEKREVKYGFGLTKTVTFKNAAKIIKKFDEYYLEFYSPGIRGIKTKEIKDKLNQLIIENLYPKFKDLSVDEITKRIDNNDFSDDTVYLDLEEAIEYSGINLDEELSKFIWVNLV